MFAGDQPSPTELDIRAALLQATRGTHEESVGPIAAEQSTWSLHHVYHHIEFSRIAVRNNHAITETMTLWLAGHLYPALHDVSVWSASAKTWLEEEIAYQCYEDGTYIQHSHNYQRVVMQLLTWGIRLGRDLR